MKRMMYVCKFSPTQQLRMCPSVAALGGGFPPSKDGVLNNFCLREATIYTRQDLTIACAGQ